MGVERIEVDVKLGNIYIMSDGSIMDYILNYEFLKGYFNNY